MPADQAIVALLREALDLAERGEIAGILVVTADGNEATSVGFVERDYGGALLPGAAYFMHASFSNPEFDEAVDDEFPSRRLAPIPFVAPKD